jgi:mannan endo-1,4-beta-mannosidase
MSTQKAALSARWCAVAATCAVLAFLSGPAASAKATGAISVQAKRSAILGYLHELQKQEKTLLGVQVNEYEVYIKCTSQDRLFEQTGKRTAILGLELMNSIAYPPYAAYLTDRALTQTASGGLVEMSWHQRNPVEVCPRGEFYECAKKPMTEETLRAVLTDGTPEHKLWLADVDAIAKVLGNLRKRGIVVLFRPYHEMNREYFWWGQKDAYPQLWDALYDELAVRHKLDNLIWVWSIDRDVPDAKPYFPLRHKPDVVGTDMYELDSATPKFITARANVTAASGGSAIFAITEVGLAPTAKVLDDVNPAWVLLWGDDINADWAWNNDCPGCNKPEQISEFFKLDRIVTLGKMPAKLRATVATGVVDKHPLHRKNPTCPAKLH